MLLGNATEVYGDFLGAYNRGMLSVLSSPPGESNTSGETELLTAGRRSASMVVIDMKKEINRLADSAVVHQARRLVAEEPNRLPAYSVEMDILQNLKRIFYFSKRMARMVVPSGIIRQAI